MENFNWEKFIHEWLRYMGYGMFGFMVLMTIVLVVALLWAANPILGLIGAGIPIGAGAAAFVKVQKKRE